jgi:hypothetical protein
MAPKLPPKIIKHEPDPPQHFTSLRSFTLEDDQVILILHLPACLGQLGNLPPALLGREKPLEPSDVSIIWCVETKIVSEPPPTWPGLHPFRVSEAL